MKLQGGLSSRFLENINQEKRAFGDVYFSKVVGEMMCCIEDSITLSIVFLLRVLYT